MRNVSEKRDSCYRNAFPQKIRAFSDELGWDPLPPLVVPNASTTLLLLESNSMNYNQPVEDPWFSAHIVPPPSARVSTKSTYQADSPVSAMACINQYQVCNPATSPINCTILGGYNEVSRQRYKMNFNDHQEVIIMFDLGAIGTSTTYWVTNGLGMAPLLAQEMATGLTSAGLPNNQWQLEFQTWFKTTLASIQVSILAFPVQPKDLGPGLGFWPASITDRATRDFCSNMRIQNTGGYQSFSTLGLIIILALGIPIILLSLILEPCVARFRRGKRIGPREVARIADSVLQLQRQVLTSAAPEVDWKARTRTVPITIDPTARFPLPRRVVRAESKNGGETVELNADYEYRREEGKPPNFLAQRVEPPPLYLLPVSPIADSRPSSPSTLRNSQ